MKPVWCALVVTLFFCACSSDASEFEEFPAAVEYSGPIYVWNKSQFDLLEIRTHPTGDYAHAPNQLAAPLEPDAGAMVDIPFGTHLTALRDKVEEGALWALTTATPLVFQDSLSVLLIFDDGFRIMGTDEAAELQGYAGPVPP